MTPAHQIYHLWVALMRTPLGPVRGMIGQGEAEGRPFDTSALAETLDMPRTTVIRSVHQLVAAGEVRRNRDGRRIVLYLTEDGWNEWRATNQMVDEFLSRRIT